jgi:hypothetical protein
MAVVEFKQIRRFPYAEGREFGDTGAYEQIDALLTFANDPAHEANKEIIDLELAPRDSEGRVRFTADFSIVKPVDTSKGSQRLLIELPNRGRRRVIDSFNRTDADAAASPEPGDGFLFERGLTVASIGWQWDVYADDVLMGLNPPLADLSGESDPGKNSVEIRPNIRQSTWLLADRMHRPIKAADENDVDSGTLFVKDYEDDPNETVVPSSSWKLAKETPNGPNSTEPSDEHIYLEGGFEPGKFYQFVYSTKEAPIGGAGLIALRDVTSFLKYDSTSLVNDLGQLDHAIGYGVSQTGRMLRHFMYLGLNVDEQDRKVFDGLMPHIAGGRKGAFNHRFGQPSNQSYPSYGHLYPFADIEVDDPFSDKSDSLLKRLNELNAVPKIVYTNSSSEYWRGDCSLMHTDPLGTRDVDLDPNARMYHFTGTQHSPGSVPQNRKPGAEGALGLYDYNVVDYSPLLRAALVNLENWIANGTEPPPSTHARIGEETAVPQANVLNTFDQLPDQVTPDRSKLWVIRTIDLGERADEGVAEYPVVEGETYPCLVSAVDSDGNEIAGVRLPDITQPVASHTGWNLRDPETGSADQQVPMMGFSRWFPATREERDATGDIRPSIEERYSTRTDYVELVTRDTEKLVQSGFVLAQDTDLVVNNATDRYDIALTQS